MQEEMGINKLAQMFMGNPQPLQAKVEQSQKQAKPGEIPPDLKEALALQQILKNRNAMQNQQAMQAGGPQPTILDKLRQMLGQNQPQGGMPPMMAQAGPPQGGMPPQGMPPVQAAHGGHIAQLASNLGQHYDGGGIVAFKTGDEVEKPEESDGPEWGASLRATRLAKEAEARKRMEEERARNMAQVNAQPGEMRPVMQNDPRMMGATPPAETVGIPQALNNPPPAAAPRPSAPRPPAAPVAPSAAAQPNNQPPAESDDLKSLLATDVRNTLKRNPEEERDKNADYYRKTVGLDALLKEQEARAAAREARYKEAQENRTPEWVRGLQAASGPAVRGGLGMLLGQMGRGATAARDEYAASDAKFADEQDRLRDVITKAKIEGNTAVANAGIKALEQLRMDHQNARTTGASLVNTDESIKSRNQIASDNRLAREQADRHRREDRATATTERADAHFKEQAMRLAMTAAQKAKDSPAGMARYKDTSTEMLAASMFDSIYNALKTGKMNAAPGAPQGPGGTPADIAALLQKYGGK